MLYLLQGSCGDSITSIHYVASGSCTTKYDLFLSSAHYFALDFILRKFKTECLTYPETVTGPYSFHCLTLNVF